MKIIKLFNYLLLCLTVASLPISFALCNMIGESDIFGIFGTVRYSWVMMLFSVIPISLIILGVSLKKKSDYFYKINFAVGIISLFLLIVFGSFRFMFTNVSYDVEVVDYTEETTGVELPDDIKVASVEFESYNITYIKLNNENEKENFIANIKASHSWNETLSDSMYRALPISIQAQAKNFDYFVSYNKTINQFSSYVSDEFSYVIMLLDVEMSRVIILEN